MGHVTLDILRQSVHRVISPESGEKMLRSYCAVSLVFCIPLQAIAEEAPNLTPQEHLSGPYIGLLELPSVAFPKSELKSLHAAIEEEQKREAENCEKNEKHLRAQVESARNGLKQLNGSSSYDSRAMAAIRANLHDNIAALEQARYLKKTECEHTIPATFEIKLAKIYLLEHWPERRGETARRIDDGRARKRKHGDVDDIGYRKLVEGQEKDVAVGEQAIHQIVSGTGRPVELRDMPVQHYVEKLAGRIATHSDLKMPLHVTVLDTAEINCIGLPGGFLVLTSGLILASQTEGELAGVISQQIARIAARQGTRSSKRSIISKIFVPATEIATGLFTGGVSNAGAYYGMNYGFQGLGVLMDKALLTSNANGQREADQLGIQYAWNAGFDPRGLIAFLDSLAQEKQYSRTGRFFLTKPALGERLLDAFTEIQYLPTGKNYTADSAEFRAAKERVKASM
jgi:hypothetical protein